MRYRIRVVRVQHVERVVSAGTEEAALERIRAEIDRPYGMLASWKTDDFTVEVIETEHAPAEGETSATDGPLLLSVRAAAEQLGISRAVLYEMMHRGEIESLRIGRRMLISRAGLHRFIDSRSGGKTPE